MYKLVNNILKHIRILSATLGVMALCLLVPIAAHAGPLDCTTPDGQPGVKVSIKIGGQDCIAIGSGDLQTNIIVVVLKYILAFLAGGVGLGVVIGIILGGFLYITARGDAAQVKRAETIIRDAVIALLVFLGMAAILNFIIPGGILG